MCLRMLGKVSIFVNCCSEPDDKSHRFTLLSAMHLVQNKFTIRSDSRDALCDIYAC